MRIPNFSTRTPDRFEMDCAEEQRRMDRWETLRNRYERDATRAVYAQLEPGEEIADEQLADRIAVEIINMSDLAEFYGFDHE